MKKPLLALGLLAGLGLAAPAPAAAQFVFSFTQPGFSVVIGDPCPRPRAYYYPPPVVYVPRPVYLRPTPVVDYRFAPPGHGWGRWKHHHDRDWDDD